MVRRTREWTNIDVDASLIPVQSGLSAGTCKDGCAKGCVQQSYRLYTCSTGWDRFQNMYALTGCYDAVIVKYIQPLEKT